MPIHKILAPFLPVSENMGEKPAHVLSPALPFSPLCHKTTVINRNSVIELSTVDDDASAKSDETVPDQNNLKEVILDAPIVEEHIVDDAPIEEEVIVEQIEQNRLELGEENAVVLHENSHALAMYQPAHVSAGIDFSPPAEFLQDKCIEDLIQTNTMVSDTLKTSDTETNKMVPSDFIQSIPSEPISDIFTGPRIHQEKEANFAMETTFRKSESDFKTKCMKMIRNARGLVCKPESPKPMQTISTKPVGPRPVLKPIDTNLLPSAKKEEVACSTPIYYLYRNVTQQTSKPDKEPTTPYKSPVMGSVAYDFKLLCEESFFGRW